MALQYPFHRSDVVGILQSIIVSQIWYPICANHQGDSSHVDNLHSPFMRGRSELHDSDDLHLAPALRSCGEDPDGFDVGVGHVGFGERAD